MLRNPTIVLVILLSAASCAANTHRTDRGGREQGELRTLVWHDTKHHTKDGFRNIWPAPPRPGFFRIMRWVIPRMLNRESHSPIRMIPVKSDILKEQTPYFRLVWAGHDFTVIRIGGSYILTDPQASDRSGPVSFAGPERITPMPFQIKDLPRVDYVIISHNHYDHLDRATVQEIERRFHPLFLVPLGLEVLLEEWGVSDVVEMDWWQSFTTDSFEFICTPARHFSSRSLTDRDETLWASWFVKDRNSDFTLYFAGDTGYGPHFRTIRRRLGAPHVALIPIGAYLPRWLMKEVHVTPEEALDAFGDLDALYMIPIHWGTFDLADEDFTDPADRLRKEVKKRSLDPARIPLLPVGGVFQGEKEKELSANSMEQE